MYDYVDGKLDWIAAGLPWEGELRRRQPIADLARRDVSTCGLHERIADVRERVRAAGWDRCAVVNERGVVLGMLSGKDWHTEADATAEEVMRPGPGTFRPHVPLQELFHYMHEHEVAGVLVTTSSGVLIGYLPASEAARALREHQVGVHG